MSLKTIAGQDYEDVCVFQSDNGKIYVAMRDTDTPTLKAVGTQFNSISTRGTMRLSSPLLTTH